MRAFRLVFLGLAAGAALAVAVPSASAANIAPNPGFEDSAATNTGAADWFDLGGDPSCEEGERTNSPVHSGGFSMRILANDPSSCRYPGIKSSCVTAAPGNYTLAAYYLIASAVTSLGSFSYGVEWYSNDACTGIPQDVSDYVQVTTPQTDNQWHQLGPSLVDAPIGTAGALIQIYADCNPMTNPCPTNAALFVDDVLLSNAAPTAVTVRSASASRTSAGARVTWKTGTEAAVAGYHVYREVAGQRVRADRTLIRAAARHAYSFVDRSPASRHATRYWVQVVALNGARSWFRASLR